DNVTVTAKVLSDKSIGIIDRVEIYNNDGLVISQKNNSNADSVILKKNITVNKSQWITAVVFCTNGAIAHTSPVYILANNKPVFDHEKAPAIIAKQMKLLDQIAAMEKARSRPDQGVLERVEKARQFYKGLL
ncbi:MAG: hypothetical protein J7497_02085, partial [Chitinophagaceae bacterium]|nr:hypothetical protein [Chitinophagaceae bacterium]